jgi:hypothetical protein
MLHGHGNYFARLGAITDEFDGFSLRLQALDELFESSSLDEEFNGILQVDAVISGVSVALVESTVFCYVDSLPLLRWSLWWLDASLY